MKICERHAALIKDKERFNEIFEKFKELRNVYQFQEKIESRKNGCMVCAFGREGTADLLDLCKTKQDDGNAIRA